MPVIARIDGVTIELYPAEHPPPHVHARYAEHMVLIDISNGAILKGGLPPAQMRKVVTWMSGREDRLMNAWLAIVAGRKPEKIND
jgi:hypothetical protein